MITLSAIQVRAERWAQRVFGKVTSKERALRLVEEAVEFAQAIDIPHDKILLVIEQVYIKEKGEPKQEISQVLLSALIAAGSVGLNATDGVIEELQRINTLPDSHFRSRNSKKVMP